MGLKDNSPVIYGRKKVTLEQSPELLWRLKNQIFHPSKGPKDSFGECQWQA